MHHPNTINQPHISLVSQYKRGPLTITTCTIQTKPFDKEANHLGKLGAEKINIYIYISAFYQLKLLLIGNHSINLISPSTIIWVYSLLYLRSNYQYVVYFLNRIPNPILLLNTSQSPTAPAFQYVLLAFYIIYSIRSITQKTYTSMPIW